MCGRSSLDENSVATEFAAAPALADAASWSMGGVFLWIVHLRAFGTLGTVQHEALNLSALFEAVKQLHNIQNAS